MRKIVVPILTFALLAALGCEKRTETQTTTDSTGTVEQKSTTVSATVPAVDTAATAAAKQEVKDAAHATGTAMETAGKEIQRRTKPEKKQ
jgi:hypothetical protein